MCIYASRRGDGMSSPPLRWITSGACLESIIINEQSCSAAASMPVGVYSHNESSSAPCSSENAHTPLI